MSKTRACQLGNLCPAWFLRTLPSPAAVRRRRHSQLILPSHWVYREKCHLTVLGPRLWLQGRVCALLPCTILWESTTVFPFIGISLIPLQTREAHARSASDATWSSEPLQPVLYLLNKVTTLLRSSVPPFSL